MRKITFEQAKSRYTNRFTMEHVPQWARFPAPTGKYYAPQFKSDKEWFDNTVFPGEKGLHGNSKHCVSSGESWPLGDWLENPYSKM